MMQTKAVLIAKAARFADASAAAAYESANLAGMGYPVDAARLDERAARLSALAADYAKAARRAAN